MTLGKPAHGMGRPSLPKQHRRNARIVIMVTEDEREVLQERARRTECSLSTVCRQIILGEMQREEPCEPIQITRSFGKD